MIFGSLHGTSSIWHLTGMNCFYNATNKSARVLIYGPIDINFMKTHKVEYKYQIIPQ